MTGDQLHGLVSLFLNLYSNGINVGQLFWGLWLFPMGYLVYKSGYLPRIIGILLMIGCFGYLAQSFAAFLVPNFTANIAVFTAWVEFLLPAWLLIKGINVEAWEKRTLASVSA